MIKPLVFALAICGAAQPADAQVSASPIPSVLPNMSSVSPGNAAGVLQYCISKDLVSSTSGGVVLERLTKKPDVAKSPDFAAGASGQILGDKSFSIGSASPFLQSQACDLVLKQAQRSG